MTKTEIVPGVSLVEVDDAGLSILCGCPENAVKHLIKAGAIRETENRGVRYETGPNAVLLSDIPVQSGMFSNLAEFPVLQMLYRQGKGIPGHPGNDGSRPMLIGLREQVTAQAEYIYLGNYGLPMVRDLEEAGLPKHVAAERMRMKLAFSFGSIKKTEELLELKIVDKDAIELRNGVFLRRIGLNRYEFLYAGQTVQVDMNLPPGTRYAAPYSLPHKKLVRAAFGVTHIGEGDGWDPERPCMGSLIDANGSLYLVDAGPNIADSLDALGIAVSDLRGIFQTHAHDDHFVGLTALLASETKPTLFATLPVRASVARKFRAITGMDEAAFGQFFDYVPLFEGRWNELDGLDVMPVFSPHPVETDVFFFRSKGPGGIKTYAHLADIAAFKVLDKMISDDPAKPGVSSALVAQAKAAYLEKVDIKKLDIGGGMIHGDALDFASDQSGEILLSHLARDLTPIELRIGRRPEFGETSILVPALSGISVSQPGSGPMEGKHDPVRLANFLSTSTLFAAPVSAASILALIRAASIHRATTGTRLAVESGLYIVITGVVQLMSGSRIVERIGPMGCFGEEMTLFRTSTLFGASAATDCELLQLAESAILERPLLCWRLHEQFTRRLVALRSIFPLEWMPEYSVGIPRLDAQHREEFALVDATVKYYRNLPDAPEPLPIVDELLIFAREHFDTENGLMEKYGFPQFHEHRDEHERLWENLQSLRLRVDEVAAGELMDFLKDWILRHTLLMDRQYTDYLVSKGAS